MGASASSNQVSQARQSQSSQQGFSLLEILIALVFTGLVVGALLQIFGTAMRSALLASEYSFAIQLAESRLQTVGYELAIEQGSHRGNYEGTAYRWKVSMEPIQLSDDQDMFSMSVQPYLITVYISWLSDNRLPREFVLTTLRFGEKV